MNNLKKIVITVLAIMVFIGIKANVGGNAAEQGRTMGNPVRATLGTEYETSWNKDTDHLYYYVEFSIPSDGYITIKATKPFDSKGEYGRLYFTLYNEDGDGIWEFVSAESVKDAKAFYKTNVGLKSGTYYLGIIPGFTVTSGDIETTYSISYEKDNFYEKEPNDSARTAMEIEFNEFYSGDIGSDGYYSSDFESADYYKFRVEKGKTYNILFDNFESVWAEYKSEIYFTNVKGKSEEVYDFETKVDSDGYRYYVYKASDDGMCYVYFDYSHGVPVHYRIKVVDTSNPGNKNDNKKDNSKVGELDEPISLLAGTSLVVGKADPGAKVYVKYNKKTYSGKADKSGYYRISTAKLGKGKSVVIWQKSGGETSKKKTVKIVSSY